MKNIKIHFFDLDHTLINTDCEWAWKNMLVEMGIVPTNHRTLQDMFTKLHSQGKLPIDEYFNFLVDDFVGKSESEILLLAEKNFENNIRGKIFPAAMCEIKKAIKTGKHPIILSGSFRQIVDPVAAHFGIKEIVCTELEICQEKFTGNLASEFCVGEGKLKRAQEYCLRHNYQLNEAAFFGDSISDIPILRMVGQANVVNPCPQLSQIAKRNGWRILAW